MLKRLITLLMMRLKKVKIKFMLNSLKILLITFFFGFSLINSTHAASSKAQPESQIKDPNPVDGDFEEFRDFDFQVKPTKEVYDPFEPVNRKVFIFNEFIDRHFVRHVAIYYQKSLPIAVRKSIRNFFDNIKSPFTVANSLLQGNSENAMAGFSSFLINSTLGVGGLFDVAGRKDILYYEEDLGQTFATYGIGPGPYLILPFLGPSNIRDTSGLIITNLSDPLSINIFKVGDNEIVNDELLTGFTVVSLIDKRESLLKIVDDMRENSFDIYATTRSAYIQNRQSKINNEN